MRHRQPFAARRLTAISCRRLYFATVRVGITVFKLNVLYDSDRPALANWLALPLRPAPAEKKHQQHLGTADLLPKPTTTSLSHVIDGLSPPQAQTVTLLPESAAARRQLRFGPFARRRSYRQGRLPIWGQIFLIGAETGCLSFLAIAACNSFLPPQSGVPGHRDAGNSVGNHWRQQSRIRQRRDRCISIAMPPAAWASNTQLVSAAADVPSCPYRGGTSNAHHAHPRHGPSLAGGSAGFYVEARRF